VAGIAGPVCPVKTKFASVLSKLEVCKVCQVKTKFASVLSKLEAAMHLDGQQIKYTIKSRLLRKISHNIKQNHVRIQKLLFFFKKRAN
jgi:hypothetical protein